MATDAIQEKGHPLRFLRKWWLFIVPVVVVTVVVAVVLAWVIPMNLFWGRTGLGIENGTNQTAAFSIASDFRSGPLAVAARGVGQFDVAVGFIFPQSFKVTITAPNGRVLFGGTLNPGVECWAYSKWNGTVLQGKAYTLCT